MLKGRRGRTISLAANDQTTLGRLNHAHEPLLYAVEAIAHVAAEAESVTDGLARTLEIFCSALQWPLGHVYQRAAESSTSLVSAELWRLEQPQQFVTLREQSERTTFRAGQGLIGQVLAQQRPELSPDVTRDRRFLRRRAAQADGVHAWLAFPVITNGQVVAVCELFATERVRLDRAFSGIFASAGMILGQLYERERWRREIETLRRQLASGAQAGLQQNATTLNALAAAIAHEVNSPLFSARASLALLKGEPGEQQLLACANADLARIAAVMAQLNSLAQAAPLGQRLASFVEQPVA
jgi:signal transduction histidine kinase